MKVKFRRTDLNKEHLVRTDIDQFYLLDVVPTNWSSSCLVAVRKDAVDIVLDEPTYSIGQRFRVNSEEYILAQVEPFKVALIGLSTGNRYKESISVGNTTKITQQELNRMSKTKVILL